MANIIPGIMLGTISPILRTSTPFLSKKLFLKTWETRKAYRHLSLSGVHFIPIKTKFNVSGNASHFSNGLVNLNGLGDQYTSYLFQPKITIENIGKKVFNLRGGFGYTYSINQYL